MNIFLIIQLSPNMAHINSTKYFILSQSDTRILLDQLSHNEFITLATRCYPDALNNFPIDECLSNIKDVLTQKLYNIDDDNNSFELSLQDAKFLHQLIHF